jgi:putative MATE family efflux protein
MASRRFKAVDAMGTDPITSLLIKYSTPSVIANLVTASYNLVDAIFIGRLGTAALAAIAVANPIMVIYNGLGRGTGIGASSMIGRYFGAKKSIDEVSKIVGNAIVSFFVLGGVLTAVMLLAMHSILSLFGADPSVLPFAESYMVMETACICINFLHLTLAEIVRAEGRPNVASAALIIAGIGNCIFDPILGFGLGPIPAMGMAGFALATTAGRFLGVVILFYHFARNSVYKLTWRSFVPDYKVILEIYSVGIATVVRTAGGSFAQIVANLAASPYGVVPVAILGVYFRITGFTGQACQGIAQGMLPIAAYNYGAHKLQRMGEAVGKAVVAAFTWGTLIWAIALLFPRALCSIFNTDPAFLAAGEVAVRIFSLAYFSTGVQMVMSYFFQGIGKGFLAMIIGATRQILFLVPFFLVLPGIMGVNGIWASFPCADTLSAICATGWGILEFRRNKIPVFWWRQQPELAPAVVDGPVKK